MGTRSNESIQILLVEDSPADAHFTREGFKEIELETNLHVVTNGDQALAFLRREGQFRGAPRPDMIILDLQLPGKSGHEILAEIKVAPELKRIPVVVLSSSTCTSDIEVSYDHHANCYIVKPLDLHDYLSVIKSIETFWFRTAQLPKERLES